MESDRDRRDMRDAEVSPVWLANTDGDPYPSRTAEHIPPPWVC